MLNNSHMMEESRHQKHIDKEALYRNLIKYYNNEELRLQQDITKLEKESKMAA